MTATILRRLTGPRAGLSSPKSTLPTRKPLKRALIIGINYTGQMGWELRGPHGDAKLWRQFCVDTYGFKEAHITMMLDEEGIDRKLWPTRANIIREIRNFVNDLQANDQVVFFYSGHTTQFDSMSSNEDDGKDEAIVPLDHGGGAPPQKEKVILDNELRKLMVDPLPMGVSLTAIFDSCHSGTLLDLDHYICNEVVFPFQGRGRRQPRSRWQKVERKNGHYDIQYYPKTKEEMNLEDEHPKGEAKNERSESSGGRIHIRQYRRDESEKVLSIDTALERVGQTTAGNKQYEVTRRESYSMRQVAIPVPVPRPSLPGLEKTTLSRPPTFNSVVQSISSGVSHIASGILELTRCASPEPMPNRKCSELCQPEPDPGNAVVLSIAACHDAQQAFDGPRGQTMTKCLVEILSDDPHPHPRTLVRKLGFKLHSLASMLQKKNSANMKKRKLGRRVRVHDVDFFIPQLGSQSPVAKEDRFMKMK